MIHQLTRHKGILLHAVRLAYRSGLFLAALVLYLSGDGMIPGGFRPLYPILWLIFFLDMLLRIFPSRWESPGCQKHLARNFRPIEGAPPLAPAQQRHIGRGAVAIALVWLGVNGVFGGLYLSGVIAAGVLILLFLFYSVCDIICILFFCPFQVLFMKNRCCVTCRIYNWDYAMMFTPFLFLPGPYTYSLLGMALLLLVWWEVSYAKNPAYFSPAHNSALSCGNCNEKLCRYKPSIRPRNGAATKP